MDGIAEEKKAFLAEAALRGRENAYAPYSRFLVGAALLAADGTVYTGCNVENAAYAPSVCAERTAVVKAVSEGRRHFCALAIAGGPEGVEKLDLCPPCGVCRQVLREFCGKDFCILLVTGKDTWREMTLDSLLPESFGPDQLQMDTEQGLRRVQDENI